MAEPNLQLYAKTYGTTASSYTSYTVPIIIDKVVQTGTLRWSSSGVSGNVTRPATGANPKWTEEFWWDTSGTDYQLQSSADKPDATPVQAQFCIYVDDNAAYATKLTISAYDGADPIVTQGEETLGGTTSFDFPFIKGRINTVYTAPAQYWAEASDQALREKDGSGPVETGNNSIGDISATNNYLRCSNLNIDAPTAGQEEYLWLGFCVPEDANTGIDVSDVSISIEYTYT